MTTVSKCVPVASNAHDADALAAAVGSGNVAYASSGLLCAIDNYPANGVQNCGESVGSGDYDYWSYWHGSTGTWVYANDGPAEQSVSSPADDVEGWMFQLDEPDNGHRARARCDAVVQPDLQCLDRGSAARRRPPAPAATTTTTAAAPGPSVTPTTANTYRRRRRRLPPTSTAVSTRSKSSGDATHHDDHGSRARRPPRSPSGGSTDTDRTREPRIVRRASFGRAPAPRRTGVPAAAPPAISSRSS